LTKIETYLRKKTKLERNSDEQMIRTLLLIRIMSKDLGKVWDIIFNECELYFFFQL